jgi:hypothetical protein
VPHPFAFFLANGWESTNLKVRNHAVMALPHSAAQSPPAAGSSQKAESRLPVLHFFRAALQIITPPRRTIEKSGETGNKLLHIQVLKGHGFSRAVSASESTGL